MTIVRWGILGCCLAGTAALVPLPAAAAQAPALSRTASDLASQLKSAYSEVAAARQSLRSQAGHDRAQGLLSQAESRLKNVRSALPLAQVLSKVDRAQTALRSPGPAPASSDEVAGILGEVRGAAHAVDPAAAAKLGEAEGHARAGHTGQASQLLSQARQVLKANPIESLYDKVVAARSLLSTGKAATAKGLLDRIPTLTELESSLSRVQAGQAIGGAGSAGRSLPRLPR